MSTRSCRVRPNRERDFTLKFEPRLLGILPGALGTLGLLNTTDRLSCKMYTTTVIRNISVFIL